MKIDFVVGICGRFDENSQPHITTSFWQTIQQASNYTINAPVIISITHKNTPLASKVA